MQDPHGVPSSGGAVAADDRASDNHQMRGSWRRFAVVGLMTFTASAVMVPRQVSSDDCKYGHACPETAKDGRGCCPAPSVDPTKAAEAKQAAEAKRARMPGRPRTPRTPRT